MKWLFLAQLNSEFSIRGPWIHPPSWRQAMASFGAKFLRLKRLRLEHPTMTGAALLAFSQLHLQVARQLSPRQFLTAAVSPACTAPNIEAAGAPGLRKSWRGGELEQLSRSTWSWLSNVGHHYCRNRPCTVLP